MPSASPSKQIYEYSPIFPFQHAERQRHACRSDALLPKLTALLWVVLHNVHHFSLLHELDAIELHHQSLRVLIYARQTTCPDPRGLQMMRQQGDGGGE